MYGRSICSDSLRKCTLLIILVRSNSLLPAFARPRLVILLPDSENKPKGNVTNTIARTLRGVRQLRLQEGSHSLGCRLETERYVRNRSKTGNVLGIFGVHRKGVHLSNSIFVSPLLLNRRRLHIPAHKDSFVPELEGGGYVYND